MTQGAPRPGPPTAVHVAVGDELLLGQTVDTNGAWLGAALSDLGLHVVGRQAVEDRGPAIRQALTVALGGGEVVLVTGGLGPTPDDLTREAVAEHLGVGLETDPELVARLRERFRRRGFTELPSNNLAMAQVPRGARILPNPLGSAPGLALEVPGGGLLVLLPGVPREMRAIFRQEVAPLLEGRFLHRLRPTYRRLIHTTGIPESLLSREVERLLPPDRGPVGLAFLPDLGGVRLRFTARDVHSREEAEVWFDRLEEALEPVLASCRYRSAVGDLAEAVGRRLEAEGLTVAVAESCTGGLVAKRLTDHAGSSAYFLGGVVAYANEVKTEILGVASELLVREGAVSEAVAKAMAAGVALALGAGAGIGITGVAGPGGGTEEKPVGTVWLAACVGERVATRLERFTGEREEVRERAAQAGLKLLLELLEGGAG